MYREIELITSVENMADAVTDVMKEKYDEPDYWTRLEHQYAGMAMHGLISDSKTLLEFGSARGLSVENSVAIAAKNLAHALVEKMKEESK